MIKLVLLIFAQVALITSVAALLPNQKTSSIGLSPEEQFARERMLDLSQKGESLEKLVDICSRWDCTDQRLSTEPGSQRTPLLYAAITGARPQVEFLLGLFFAKRSNRPDIPEAVRRTRLSRAVNAAESSKGSSVAMWAMLSKDSDIVRMILTAGADLNAQDQNGWTPLFYAAASDFAAGVILCLEFAEKGGTELSKIVNAVDNHGRTALHIAVAEDARSAVTELLSSKAVDLSLEDESGQTAFDLAAHRLEEDDSIVRQFVEALTLPELPRHGQEDRTLLHTAAARGHHAAVQQILAKGFDPNPLDNNECTPLMLAAAFGHQEVVKTLLVAGAKVEGEDLLGRSALMHGVRGQNKQVLELLIDYGADTTRLANDIQFMVDQDIERVRQGIQV